MHRTDQPEEINPLEAMEPPPLSPSMLEYPTADANLPWQVGTLRYSKFGLLVLFSLLLWGDFAWSMKERSAAPVLQILIKDFHASDSTMQMFMVVIPCAITVMLGPVISYRSDRYRSRWGRRIPFLMVSTPFAVLAMFGLGFSPAMGHSLGSTLHVGTDAPTRLFFGIFWVIFEVATVAANSVFGALINDVVPRQFLGRFYGFFRAFSLIAGMWFNFQLIGLAEAHYKAIFIFIGLLYGLGFTFMCLTVKEGKYPDPVKLPADKPRGFLQAVAVYRRECFSNPYYIWVSIALMLGTLAFMPVNNFSQPFAKSLGISNDIYGKYIAATYVVSLSMALFLGDLADRFHPLRVGIVAMLLYCGVTLWGEFYAADTHVLFTVPYKSGVPVHMYAIALIGHGVLSGVFFTCTASLSQRLFPHDRFAQFASAAGILIAICSMAFALGSGWFFDHFGKIYRYTYLMGFVLSSLGVFSMLMVHRGFMKLGGTRNYVAP